MHSDALHVLLTQIFHCGGLPAGSLIRRSGVPANARAERRGLRYASASGHLHHEFFRLIVPRNVFMRNRIEYLEKMIALTTRGFHVVGVRIDRRAEDAALRIASEDAVNLPDLHPIGAGHHAARIVFGLKWFARDCAEHSEGKALAAIRNRAGGAYSLESGGRLCIVCACVHAICAAIRATPKLYNKSRAD